MRLVFMGTPKFARVILENLVANHEVVLVVTQPDRMTGRKKEWTASPVKQLALSLDLPLFQPERLMHDYAPVLEAKPDYIVTAAYGQMLPNALLNSVQAINVHGSLLPKYRGGAPIQYALFDGLKETGITIMYMAFKMDSGDIIKQEKLLIEDHDTYGSLSVKLSHLGAKALDEVLRDITLGKITRIPQNPNDVTFAYTLKREDEYLSFHWPTDTLINRIRGLSPEPGGYLLIKDTIMKVYHAKKSDIMDEKSEPGTILDCHKRLIIKTLDGAIEILEMQMLGKKRMTAQAFLNGQTFLKKMDRFIERKSL